MSHLFSDIIPPIWKDKILSKGEVYVTNQTLETIDTDILKRYLTVEGFCLAPNNSGVFIRPNKELLIENYSGLIEKISKQNCIKKIQNLPANPNQDLKKLLTNVWLNGYDAGLKAMDIMHGKVDFLNENETL